VDTYLRQFLNKGVPSTFVSLKSLYSNLEKRQVIQDLAESYLVSLKETSAIASNNKDN
jgi:peptide alpha-N-acetyltransferase